MVPRMRRERLREKNFSCDTFRPSEKTVWNGSDTVTRLSTAEIPEAVGRLKILCVLLLTLLVVMMTACSIVITILVSRND